MGALAVLFLSIAAINFVFSEPENVSIVTEGEIPSSIPEEILRVQETGFLEDDDQEVFKRAKGDDKWRGGKYTKKERKLILEAHNNYRRGVSPESSNMREMKWSSKLAEQAQAWSDGCFFDHPNKEEHPDFVGIGQNLHLKGPYKPLATDPVDSWYREVKDYHYQQNYCSGDECRHYTQIVWASTNKVGCGITFCPLARGRGTTYENIWLVTCNYSPGGNIWGEWPYESGQQCSSCTLSMKKGFCRDGLCSNCKGGVKDCDLCEDHDPRCGDYNGWPTRWCIEQHPYVLAGCPVMCQLCEPGDGRPRC